MVDHTGKSPRVAAVLIFGLLLSGCAAAQATAPSATATGSAVPTVDAIAPTPTATPTPAAVDPNDPRSWIIGFTSVGPVALGDEMSQAIQSMTAFATNDYFDICPTIASFDKPGSPDFVMTAEEDGTIRQIVLQGGADPSSFASNSPRTSTGIGIGSTLAELETAYPTLADLNDLSYPHYAATDGNGNWTHFGVAEGVVHVIVVHAYADMPRELCG